MSIHFRFPDISAIIQEIVNQSDWASGNALVLIFNQDPANPSTGVVETEAGTDPACLVAPPRRCDSQPMCHGVAVAAQR
ncbi:MAG: hypothetical protein ACYTBX_09770 [Planctomycetota bacterium]